MQPLLNRLTRVMRQTAATSGRGVCPATEREHVAASSEALFELTDEGGREVLSLWLCIDCQGMFYTRESR